MGNFAKGVTTVAVLFAAVIFAYVLLATAPVPEQVAPEEVATAIRVMSVKQGSVQLEVDSQGSVVPQTQSELIPEVSGRVQWVSPNLVAGGFFRKGEVLLRMDKSDYLSTLSRSQAGLTRARAEEELAGYELARMKELVKRKLVSQSSMESVLRNHRIATAALQDSQLAMEQAKRDLMRTEIRAPYDGLVRTERVDLGQYIGRGQSIASIYASAAVEVRLPVADRQLAYLDLPLGHRGELSAQMAPVVTLSTEYGGTHYEWSGRLVRTEAEIDSKSRMVTAVARVANDDNAGQPHLPVGLFVNARIKGRWVEDVVTLPRAALRNQTQVLVVDQDDRLRFREVEILRFDRDQVLVKAGIAAGERVNISPIQTVIEGMKVNPQLVGEG